MTPRQWAAATRNSWRMHTCTKCGAEIQQRKTKAKILTRFDKGCALLEINALPDETWTDGVSCQRDAELRPCMFLTRQLKAVT